MMRPGEASEAGEDRPTPRRLRRSSRTHWPLWRVLLWVALELAVVALAVLALVWLLAR